MKADIQQLFIKLVDNAINEEELDRLSSLIQRADTAPIIQQLLAEYWDYTMLTSKEKNDDFSEVENQIERKRESFDALLQIIRAQNAKIKDGQEKSKKKYGILDWMKRILD